MITTKFVGSSRVTVDDVAEFEATPDSFELIDVLNYAPMSSNSGIKFLDVPGFFVYELDIDVDMPAAINKRLLGFEIKVYANNPQRRIPLTINAANHVKESEGLFNRAKEYIESKSDLPIAESYLSLDVKLPNDAVQTQASSAPLVIEPIAVPVYLSSPTETSNDRIMNAIKTTYGVTVPSVVNIGSKKNFLDVGLSNGNLNGASFKKAMTNINVDQAQVSKSIKPTLPTLSSAIKPIANATAQIVSKNFKEIPIYNKFKIPDGIESSRKNQLFSLNITRKNLLEKDEKKTPLSRYNNISDAVRQLASSPLNPQTNLSSIAVLAYQGSMVTNVKNYKHRMQIPKSSLGTNQYVYFSLKPIIKDAESKGVVVETSYYFVEHRKQLDDLLIPIVPPIMVKQIDVKGQIEFLVQQNDPVADSIVVTRMVSHLNSDSGHRPFESISLQAGESKKIVDLNPNNSKPNTVTYRAITNYNGSDGAFSSLTYEGHRNIISNAKNSYESDVNIVAFNEKEGIKLELSKFPSTVLAVKLNRVDLTSVGPYKNKISTVLNSAGNAYSNVTDSETKIIYLDSNVSPNRIYKYFCTFEFPKGKRANSVEDEIVKREVPFSNLSSPFKVTFDSTALTISEDDGTYRFTTNLNLQVRDTAFQFLKNVFEQQNAFNEFENFISENKDRITDLVAFKVVRIDLNTSKKHYIGVIKAGPFTDDSNTSEDIGIPKLEPGNSYSYIFNLCLINPSSVLFDAVSKLSTGKKPGSNDISYNPTIFNSTTFRKKGILPSNKKLSKPENFKLLLSKSVTNIVFKQNLNIPKSKATVTNLNCKVGSQSTLISWDLEGGSLNEVDHCIVKVSVNGNEQILTSVVCSSSTSNMTAVDNKYCNELGDRSYNVVVVYNDGSTFVSSPSETLYNASNIKIKTLRNMINRGVGKIEGTSSSKFLKNFTGKQLNNNLLDSIATNKI